MFRTLFNITWWLVKTTFKLLLGLLALADGSDDDYTPANQYERRSSWDRTGYSWTGRPD